MISHGFFASARTAGLALLAMLPVASHSFAYGSNQVFSRANFSFQGHLDDQDRQEAYRIVKALGIPEQYKGFGTYAVFSFICGDAVFEDSAKPCSWKVKKSEPAVVQAQPKGSDLAKLHALMVKAGGSFDGGTNPMSATYPAQFYCDTPDYGMPGKCSMEFDVGFRSVSTQSDASKAHVANKMMNMLARLGVPNTSLSGQVGETYDVNNIACVSESRVSRKVECDPVVTAGLMLNTEYYSALNSALTTLGSTNNKIGHSFFEKISLHCTRLTPEAADASCEITYIGADVRGNQEF